LPILLPALPSCIDSTGEFMFRAINLDQQRWQDRMVFWQGRKTQCRQIIYLVTSPKFRAKASPATSGEKL
jgi:hypothetical protein